MRGNVRLKEFLRRLRGLFPLTARGLLVATVAALALTFVAYEALDFVVLVLAYAALGLTALGVLVVVVGAIVLSLRISVPPSESRLLTDRHLPTDFPVPSLGRVPLLELHTELVNPPFERREEGGRELLRARHRGVYEEAERRVSVRDAFGLAEVSLEVRGGRLFSLPHLGALEPSIRILSASLGDDLAHPRGAPEGDRIETRRYAPGDPARFIHWKVYARSGELVVRMPERAISRADRVAVYLVAGEQDEASAALFLALARGGELGTRVILGCDGWDQPIDAVDDAELAVARSRGERGAAGLGAFLKRAEASGPIALGLIVPAQPGAWLGRALEVLKARPAGAKVLVGIDGVGEEAPSWLRRALFERDSDGSASREALARLSSTLRGAGAEVIFVDRVTGRVFDALPGRRRAA